MPQIAQILDTYASQIFWLLIVFGLIYFGIGRGMLPKIEATVEARDKRIADDLAAAERARAKATDTEERYRVRMADARANAQKMTREAKTTAAAEADVRVKAADADIAASTGTALQQLAAQAAEAAAGIEVVAVEAAQEIVVRLSGAQVTRDQAAGAVKAALAHG